MDFPILREKIMDRWFRMGLTEIQNKQHTMMLTVAIDEFTRAAQTPGNINQHAQGRGEDAHKPCAIIGNLPYCPFYHQDLGTTNQCGLNQAVECPYRRTASALS
jgi:hypothetical protein